MAEAVRFELTIPFSMLHFECSAISRALPRFLNLVPRTGLEPARTLVH